MKSAKTVSSRSNRLFVDFSVFSEALRQFQQFAAQQNAPDGVSPFRLFADDTNDVGYVMYRGHAIIIAGSTAPKG